MFNGHEGDEEWLRRVKRVPPVRNMRNSYKVFNRNYVGKGLIGRYKCERGILKLCEIKTTVGFERDSSSCG
jgi:hypothetical protein